MEEKETNNFLKIGELTLQSTKEPLKDLIVKAKDLLKNKDVKEYLGLINSKKINEGKGYLG